jgi:fructose-1,6-bisphosphatase I
MEGTKVTLEDFMQGGRKQVAAGYVLYGSSTILVYKTGFGVNAFTYENSLGEYFLSHSSIKIPENGIFYSINEGYIDDYNNITQKFLKDCRNQKYSARYIGSLVADFHRNMLKGGIYLYPPTTENPNGKLRLLYEAYPIAFIAEQAGGKSTNGKEDVLDILPYSLHQRTPFFVGSNKLMNNLSEIHKTQIN